MQLGHPLKPRFPCALLLSCVILLGCCPGLTSPVVVTLDSIEILKTHEWIPAKPTVYFHCKGESKIALPDVKHKHVLYTFKGEESWQPLAELEYTKCKRCGFYEKDAIKADHEFDEWELCASDFNNSDGKYTHFKHKEFNATFQCKECIPQTNASSDSVPASDSSPASSDSVPAPDSSPTPSDLVPASSPASNSSSNQITNSNTKHWAVIVGISASVSTVVVFSLIAAYKYWHKRKMQHEQARFLKLFEEGDADLEDELGIGPLTM